jgi:hypothetical protein
VIEGGSPHAVTSSRLLSFSGAMQRQLSGDPGSFSQLSLSLPN